MLWTYQNLPEKVVECVPQPVFQTIKNVALKVPRWFLFLWHFDDKYVQIQTEPLLNLYSGAVW